MFKRLEDTEKRFVEIEEKLSLPEVMNDQDEYRKLTKEYKVLSPITEKYREYKTWQKNKAEAEELLEIEEGEMKALAEEEIVTAKEEMEKITEELKILLLPRDENDDRNVVVEIRGGAGGEEAALFSYVLYRMYNMYADSQGFKTELVSANETELGGFKEVSFMISGEGAYSRMKYESGVHRVQRVPETEAQGRIHTSTVTVAVLPEAEEVDVELNPADLEIEAHRASGAGGQHVNKTDSAIRMIHKPTGIVVECQDERSQYKNRDKAMKIMRTKLYEKKLEEQNSALASERKSQVGTGDRSERIRTYNYPQGRVTDHRIGLTLYNLENILNGAITPIIEALAAADTAEKLANGEF
ncbi:MAG: peptide chain release factor 1 [Clostridia bacterium]|nr:peptide chain release factor 1 [Clostridia bacterium]MBQ7897774.1 peptide chain release factor 1 [Clostridia bacterium]